MVRFLVAGIGALVICGPARADVPIGEIKGTVIFEGEAPDRKPLDRSVDPYCAKLPKVGEDVIVTKGKLRDVLVRIKNGTPGLAVKPPAAPALIDQRECMYTPRVVGIVAGQQLAVRNSDGTFHSVRGVVNGKDLWSKPQAPKAVDLTLDTSATPGDVIDVQCGVHAWMHSYVVVQDNPYFAVTGDDGTFDLKGMPAGDYTLEAWHPTLGTRTLNVKIGVGPKAVVNARLSYKAP